MSSEKEVVLIKEKTETDEVTNEKSKTKKGKKIKINTNKCRGEINLIRMIIKKRGWKEVFDSKADIFWSGLNLTSDDFHNSLTSKVNRIPGMTELAHKRSTGFFLNKFQEYFPEHFTFFPKTFMFPENYNKILRFMKSKKVLLIAKPTKGSQGDGIILIHNKNDINSLNQKLSYTNERYIIQQYIDNPLLINNKKFDLRLYVLISSVKPIIAWLNDEGLARFCTEDYKKPTKDNLRNILMHLSNYSLNKNSSKFVYTEECQEENLGSKRTMASFWKSYTNAGHNKDSLLNDIEDLIRKFLTSMYPFMIYNQKVAFGKNEEKAKNFHIIGFDILVDDKLKPWLMEINANPSLCIDHDPNHVKLVDISPIDFYVKEKVVEYACEIVLNKVEKQLEIGRNNYYKNYKLSNFDKL